jgi:hypothetical protein
MVKRILLKESLKLKYIFSHIKTDKILWLEVDIFENIITQITQKRSKIISEITGITAESKVNISSNILKT